MLQGVANTAVCVCVHVYTCVYIHCMLAVKSRNYLQHTRLILDFGTVWICYSSYNLVYISRVNHSAKCKVWRASSDADIKNHDLGGVTA